MGMSSSQARLLTITSRIHDTELKAQNLMRQKIALGTQENEVYQKYCDALDATKIQVAYMMDDGKINMVDATYNSVATYQPNRCQQYALRDNKTNKIIVDKNVKEAYDAFGGDKYAFAMSVLGLLNTENNGYGQYIELGIGRSQKDYGVRNSDRGDYCDCGTGLSLYLTDEEYKVFKEHPEDSGLNAKHKALLNAKTDEEKRKAYDNFKNALYESYGKEIYTFIDEVKPCDNPDMERDEENIQPMLEYYANLHEAIREAGGCEVIDAEFRDGEEGRTWFDNMVKSGLVTIQEFNQGKTKKSWSDTSPATSINNNFLQEVQDEKDLKKAEAEYEHDLKLIDQKEKEFDNDLSKLETEREALKTEAETIGKVIDENIQRTFNLFDA